MKRKERKQSPNARWSLVALFALGFVFVCLCIGGATLLERIANRTSQQTPVVEVDPRNATLTLAYSPEKAVLMRQLAERFNSQDLRTADRQRMQVELVELTPDVMVEEALGPAPRFQAMTPDFEPVDRPARPPLGCAATGRRRRHCAIVGGRVGAFRRQPGGSRHVGRCGA